MKPVLRDVGRRHLWALSALLAGLVAAQVDGVRDGEGWATLAVHIGREGNVGALVVGLTVLLYLAWRRDGRPRVRTIVLVMVLETALFALIKAVTWLGLGIAARPSGGDGGFPSGHTTSHVCLAALLTEACPRLGPLWYAWAGLMAWSRVEAGAHFPYQVIAGAVLGLTVALPLLARARRVAG